MPALSVLRASSDSSSITGSALERVRTLIARGDLPLAGKCPLSGRSADQTVYFQVQCEQPWFRRGERSDVETIMYMLVLGWIVGFFLAMRRNGPVEVHGHDVSIEIPLRVSSEVLPRVLRMSRQRPLRKLLSTTPAYRELMREYPQARVTPLPAA